MLGSICRLFRNKDQTAWSDEHMRDFLNNNNRKAKQQQNPTMNCKLALDRWMEG